MKAGALRGGVLALALVALASGGCGTSQPSFTAPGAAGGHADDPAIRDVGSYAFPRAHPQAVEPVPGVGAAPIASSDTIGQIEVGSGDGAPARPVSDAVIRQELAASGLAANPSVATLTPAQAGTVTPFFALAAGNGASRVQAMVQMADSLIGKPYVIGGGHFGFGPSSGYDCSGFVSAVLHAGGYLTQPVDTTALPNQPGILTGPGQYVTIYDRALPGQSGHVLIEIDGQFYESGGEAGPWGGGGGVQAIAQPTDSYLATFPTVLHPAGL